VHPVAIAEPAAVNVDDGEFLPDTAPDAVRIDGPAIAFRNHVVDAIGGLQADTMVVGCGIRRCGNGKRAKREDGGGGGFDVLEHVDLPLGHSCREPRELAFRRAVPLWRDRSSNSGLNPA